MQNSRKLLIFVNRNWSKYEGIIVNAGSLVGTTAVTSALGFIYWWAAARLFPSFEVGVGSAAISSMTLLGTLAVFGLGTLLMGELKRHPGKELAIIVAALAVSGISGTLLGLLFAAFAPLLSPDLLPLQANIFLFSFSVGLTAITLVLDQAFIGLMRGELQLWRNTIFAVVKLIALAIAGAWLQNLLGLTILTSWTLGNLVSLIVLLLYRTQQGNLAGAYRPEWRILRDLSKSALYHHGLNLVLIAPNLILPLVVTSLLSATINAYFYAAWMIAGFVYVVPVSLSTVLYATGNLDTAALRQKVRFTLVLSLALGAFAVIILLLAADELLGLFGQAYAEQGSFTLRLLVLGVFPLIISEIYVALYRVYGKTIVATKVMALANGLKILLAILGVRYAGLPGLSIGWIAVQTLLALLVAPVVYRAIVDCD